VLAKSLQLRQHDQIVEREEATQHATMGPEGDDHAGEHDGHLTRTARLPPAGGSCRLVELHERNTALHHLAGPGGDGFDAPVARGPMMCSIFIASRASSGWPLATVSPGAAITLVMTPGIGASSPPRMR
jgi:hypothetical protein